MGSSKKSRSLDVATWKPVRVSNPDFLKTRIQLNRAHTGCVILSKYLHITEITIFFDLVLHLLLRELDNFSVSVCNYSYNSINAKYFRFTICMPNMLSETKTFPNRKACCGSSARCRVRRSGKMVTGKLHSSKCKPNPRGAHSILDFVGMNPRLRWPTAHWLCPRCPVRF